MNSGKDEHVVVVGFGWVGQANALALKSAGYSVSYFDLGNPPHHYSSYADLYTHVPRLSELRELDSEHTWYMVCVGDRVSDEGVQDISNIQKALDSLKGVKGGVILRSTVLPAHLASLPFDYYMPEFLHEKKAVEECLDPFFFVLGVRNERTEPSFFKTMRSRAVKEFRGTPEEASYIKYLSNLWNAVRVAFVNEFGNAIGHPQSEKDLQKINDITGFIFDQRSYLRYGRAYGGHCLPKDSRAFIGWHAKSAKLPLLEGMQVSNKIQETLEKEYPLMPEWYSKWPDRHLSGQRALKELWQVAQKYLDHPEAVFNRFRGKKNA